MENFEGLNLSPLLAASLAKMNYTSPTPIQAKAIPLALQGRDIMGSAQTGTGKTAAFSIPLIQTLLTNPRANALVLTPTRELGKQIMDIMHQLLGENSGIKTAFIIGGESMGKQYNQLRARPRLIVGTPGRINDHLERGTLKLNETNFLVLDETDRMLDMGFTVQLERIFKYLPAVRQTLMFSATLPENIVQMSHKYLTNPERIAVGSTIAPAKNIQQDVVNVSEDGKYDELIKQLDERKGSVIIFVKTKYATERLAKRLSKESFSAEAINGDLKQSRRDRVIKEFRAQEYRILVATDIIARGLDVPHVAHVINYDLPQVPEDYIHRIGRTARAGAEGASLCLITPQDGRKWRAIELLMNPDAAKENNKGGARGPRNDNRGGEHKKSNGKPRRFSNGKSANGKPSNGKPSFGRSGGKPQGERQQNGYSGSGNGERSAPSGQQPKRRFFRAKKKAA